jgi:hypothetical protein
MMMKILEVLLQYGVLGVIAFFFLTQNNKLFDTLIERSKTDTSSITTSIADLRKAVEDSMNQSAISSSKLNESILNERSTSRPIFVMVTEMMIELSKSELIALINDDIDSNGFTDPKRYQLLIENTSRFCEATRLALVDRIGEGLHYSDPEIKATADAVDLALESLSQNLSEMIKRYPTDNLMSDKNYKIFKNVIYNEVSKHYEKAISIAKKGV